MSPDLLSASIIAIRDCMGAAPGERLLIVSDEPLRLIGQALHRAAVELGHDVLLVEMLPRKSNGEEPPPEVAALMAAVRRRALSDVEVADAHRRAARGERRRGPRRDAAQRDRGDHGPVHERRLPRIAARTSRICALMAETREIRVEAPSGTTS
jgi:hypothetical protein